MNKNNNVFKKMIAILAHMNSQIFPLIAFSGTEPKIGNGVGMVEIGSNKNQ